MSYGTFESEKNHIWKKIAEMTTELEEQRRNLQLLESKVPETVRESSQANRKTSEYRNKAKISLEATKASEESIEAIQQSVLSVSNDINSINRQLDVLLEDAKSKSEAITSHHNILESVKNSTQPVLDELTEMVEQKPILEESIEEISELSEQVIDVERKSRSLLAEMAVSKKSIQEIHEVIFGYNTEAAEEDSNDVIRVEGLKHKLDKSYEELEKGFSELSNSFSSMEKETTEQFEELSIESTNKYQDYLSSCNKTYNGTVEKLKSLLPEALTAGLASAYEKKTSAEEAELGDHKKTFNKSILGLVVISIIPFAVNAARLLQNRELEILGLIKDMPYLVFAMMPLYIPVLWIAYSANKSYKLSKRLIEEYSHKGVVSRTFEGLANQINELDNSALSIELRTQLLFNLIAVNSENPGKLISDYNKSDHPLMDALDKSSQMANSLTKLAKIPGFSKLAKRLSDKGELILDIENRKINAVLDDSSLREAEEIGGRVD